MNWSDTCNHSTAGGRSKSHARSVHGTQHLRAIRSWTCRDNLLRKYFPALLQQLDAARTHFMPDTKSDSRCKQHLRRREPPSPSLSTLTEHRRLTVQHHNTTNRIGTAGSRWTSLTLQLEHTNTRQLVSCLQPKTQALLTQTHIHKHTATCNTYTHMHGSHALQPNVGAR